MPGHPRDVQVAVDDRGGVEAQVPVARPGGAAPLGEQRVAQRPGGLADERVVRDEDHRERRVPVVFEPALGDLDPGPAPLLDAGMGIGVQQHLVAAHDAFLVGAGQALFLGQRAVRAERVVVQTEHRRDRDRAARPVPHRVRILRGEDAQAAAELHQGQVPLFAAQRDRVLAPRPQLVVPRGPHHGGEFVSQGPQRPLDVGVQLPHVPGQQQPVPGRARPEPGDDLPVLRVRHVQVAEGQQPGCRHQSSPENRSQAACLDTPSAAPIRVQLMPRLRRTST